MYWNPKFVWVCWIHPFTGVFNTGRNTVTRETEKYYYLGSRQKAFLNRKRIKRDKAFNTEKEAVKSAIKGLKFKIKTGYKHKKSYKKALKTALFKIKYL